MGTVWRIGLSLLCLLGATKGLTWSQGLDSNRGPINVCSGEDIQLFGNFTLQEGERLQGIVWTCQRNGQASEVLATFTDEQFLPTSSYSGRLSLLKDGGLQVSCATILESGNYSVAVSTESASSLATVHHDTALVQVIDVPKTSDGEMHVTNQREAVRDVTTGEWHVQLSCGNFSDRGHPSIDVIWTNPKGEELSSSSFEDGYFHLLVPNPVVGGNYTCRVNFIQPMPKCLEDNSPLLHRPCVYVEETPARFSLLEARQKEFFERLTEERGNWLDAMDTLANRTDELQQSFDKSLRYKEPIHFHVRLAKSVYMSSGNIIKFSQIISNQGQGYNATTGLFIAPTDGNYFFVASTGSYGNSNSADMYLMKGGKEVGRTHLYQYSDYQTMGSCHATLTLKQGEKVWMQSYNGNSYFQQSITSFTGFSF